MNDKITKTIQDFLQHVASPVDEVVIVHDDEVDLIKFVLSIENPNSLIGRNGEALRSMNYLVRKIVEAESSEQAPNFVIDINDYYAKKIEDIKTRAKIIADRAVSFNRSVELEPMSAYDRLIVHSYLSKFPGVTTESTGEGRDRRVIVNATDKVE